MKKLVRMSLFLVVLGVSRIVLADNSLDPTDPNSFDLNSLMDTGNVAAAVKPGTKAEAAKISVTENHSSNSSSSLIFGSDLGYSMSNAADGQSYLLAPHGFQNVSNKKSGGLAFGGHIGYRYDITPSLLVGVEMGYLNLSNASVVGTNPAGMGNYKTSYKYSVKEQLVTMLGTLDYRIASHYDIFTKFGPALVLQSSAFNFSDPATNLGNDLSASAKNYKIKPFLSVGAGYAWNQFEFSVAYDHLFGDTATNQDVRQEITSIGNNTKIENKIFTQSAIMGSIGYALPI